MNIIHLGYCLFSKSDCKLIDGCSKNVTVWSIYIEKSRSERLCATSFNIFDQSRYRR